VQTKSITLQQAAGYGLNIKAPQLSLRGPWAKSKGTKQSKMRDCFTEPALNEVNVFAMTI